MLFDLVFVFAVSQLSDHLLTHLNWLGAAETAVLLVAVFSVWAYTSFEATSRDVERKDTQRTLLAVMFLGLFMNAAISSAFSSSPWPFAVPYLISQIGPTAVTAITVGPAELRRHYRRVLVWLAAAAPLWIAGAILQPRPRLACWAAAAAIDLAPDPESIRARSPRTHHAGTATPLATCSQAKPLMRATVFPHEPALGRRAAQTARTVSPGDSLASYAAAFGNLDHAGAGAKAG